jgi:dolichol-phosphate mannosyltransferase
MTSGVLLTQRRSTGGTDTPRVDSSFRRTRFRNVSACIGQVVFECLTGVTALPTVRSIAVVPPLGVELASYRELTALSEARAPALILTVVMPAYNEEGAILSAVEEVRREILDRLVSVECLVIDDGSTDCTGRILDRIAGVEPRVRVLHQANAGHGAALRAGIESAISEWVFLLDSDRQIPIEQFSTLWNARHSHDLVMGVRARRQDSTIRAVLSGLIRITIRAIFGVRLRDANIPFKLIRRSVWESARHLIPEGTLAPSLFLAVFARVRGFRVLEIEVPHRARQSGVGSLRTARLARFCLRGIVQLVAFRWRLARCH